MVVFVGSPPPAAGPRGDCQLEQLERLRTGCMGQSQPEDRQEYSMQADPVKGQHTSGENRGVLAHTDQEEDQAGRGDPYGTDMGHCGNNID